MLNIPIYNTLNIQIFISSKEKKNIQI